MATDLPDGTLTFVFTDIEGSTRLAHELGDSWPSLLTQHHEVLRRTFPAHGGVEVNTSGDSFFVVFRSATQAVEATVAMQRALRDEDWRPHPVIQVRIGIHTGEATLHEGDYAGLTVHAASRVESAASGGQILLTQATLDAAADLPEEVGVLDLGMHRLKDLPAEVHLYQVVVDDLRREFPRVRSQDVLRNNIPVPASSFVGRTDALAKLHRHLDVDRLVTLFGPGGAGKTRLSLRLAHERLHRYRDGAWFVELDPTSDDATVAAAVADVLGVREQQGKTILEATVHHLRDREVLIVLDNCEHVIDAAARTVEAILRAGTGICVLATSREPLAIPGERVWPVLPLSTEGDDPMAIEAIRLLVDRIQLLSPEFELTPHLGEAAVSISRRLDGLPLAIELAAATITTLSLDEIASKLDERFKLLTRGSRTALDRQKTMWGAIDWSYALLDEPERGMFRRLGVFPAEFDFDAVGGVCGDGALDVVALVATLTAKSLVAATPSGRFRLLESIRAFARDQLEATGEAAAVFERHARWFAGNILRADAEPVAGRSDSLDHIHDDVTASLTWAIDHDPPLALDLVAPLHTYWVQRGRWTEGRLLSQHTLDATAQMGVPARAKVLGLTAELALMQGDSDAASALFEQAINLRRDLDGEDAAQILIGDLGAVAARRGDLETAERLYLQALTVARQRRPRLPISLALAHLAEVALLRGHLDDAAERAGEAMMLAREAGSLELAMQMVNLLGAVAQQQGDLPTARRLFGQALDEARGSGATQALPYLLFCLATLALDDSDPDAAAPLLVEAVALDHKLNDQANLVEALEATARLATTDGASAAACLLLAAASSLRESISFPRGAAELTVYEKARTDLEEHLGAGFAEQWSTGAALSVDEVVTVALDHLAARRSP